MDDTTSQPLLFSNRVIQQLVQHMVGEDVVLKPQDYLTIRRVFKQCMGSWEKLASGDQLHIGILQAVVTVWGQFPGREKTTDHLV